MTARMVIGDIREVLGQLPAGVFDLVFTSPPFFKQRAYLPSDHPYKVYEIGWEPTPGLFVDSLLDITERLDRTMSPWSSLAVEIGDGYSGQDDDGNDLDWDGLTPDRGNPLPKGLFLVPETYRWALTYGYNPHTRRPLGRLDAPCLCGTHTAQELRRNDPVVYAEPWDAKTVHCPNHGTVPVAWTPLAWRCRNNVDICRTNPTPGGLGDKYRPATSDLLIACRSADRWFDLDAVRVPHKSDPEKMAGNGGAPGKPREKGDGVATPGNPLGAPPLDWWQFRSKPYTDAHYAVMNSDVVVVPVKSMCPPYVCRVCGEPRRRLVDKERLKDGQPIPEEDRRIRRTIEDGARTANSGGNWRYTTVIRGVTWTDCGCPDPEDGKSRWRPGLVLDPFGGSGTTGMVATGNTRDCVLVDLDERNVALAEKRVGAMFFERVSVDQLVDVLSTEYTPLAGRAQATS